MNGKAPGCPPPLTKGPKGYRDSYNALRSFVRSLVHLPTEQYEVSREKDGTQLIPLWPALDGSSSATPSSPWQIINPGVNEGGVPLIGVNFFSAIFNSTLDPTDHLAVTGLLSSTTPPLTDPGLFTCPAIGGKIWLQIGTADPSDDTHALQPWAGTTQIKHADVVTTIWDEYPAISINTDDPSNPYQEFFNLLLAEVTASPSDARPALMTLSVPVGETVELRQITQMYDRNILLVNWFTPAGMELIVPNSPEMLQIATNVPPP